MITDFIQWFTGLILFITLIMLVRPIFKSQVYLYIGQAALVGIITVLVAVNLGQPHLWLTALLTIGVKAVAIPVGLLLLLKRIKPALKAPTVINPAPIALIGGLLIAFSYFIVQPIAAVISPDGQWQLVVAMSLVFLGFLMVISQRAALSQMVGFLVLENGVFLLAIATTLGLPAVVELGLFMDVVLGVTVLSLLTTRMNNLIHSTDTEQLNELKED